MGVGLTKDTKIVHNILVVLVKTLNEGNVHQIYDQPEQRNLIELTVIALEKWITELAESDKFVLHNVLKVMEVLMKSHMFYERMKNKPCLDSLIQISRDKNTP